MSGINKIEGAIYPDAAEVNLEKWNRPSTVKEYQGQSAANHTNCTEYAFGANNQTDFGFDNPGDAGGYYIYENWDPEDPNDMTYEQAVVHGVLLDNEERPQNKHVIPYEGEGLPPHVDGYYPIALFITDKSTSPNSMQGHDAHWLRANRDGTWSGTNGGGEVKIELDNSGHAITEPHNHVSEEVYSFSQYFYVPAGGVLTWYHGELAGDYETGGLSAVISELTDGVTPEDWGEVNSVLTQLANESFNNPEFAQDVREHLRDTGIPVNDEDIKFDQEKRYINIPALNS